MRWTKFDVSLCLAREAMDGVPFKKRVLVSLCDATHWRRARALQTRLEAAAVSWDGLSRL